MALFHVCHFDGFCRLTLAFAEGVHRSMSYGLQKFGRGGKKITWLTGPGKRYLRMANFWIRPWGEVPPDFTPRFPDFVLQLAFRMKPSHSKFGFKPLKPGGATGWNVVFLSGFVIFWVGVVSRLYLSCVLLYSHQSWQSGPLLDALELCEGWTSSSESDVTYWSVNTPS